MKSMKSVVKMKMIGLFTVAVGAMSPTAFAVTPVAYDGSPITEDFDALPSSGTPPAFVGIGPFDVPELDGWSFLKFAGSGTNALFSISNGTSNSGSLYSYGVAESSDRALGALGSGSGSYQFGLTLLNSTVDTVTSFTLSYTGEQYRYGGSPNQSPLNFSYAFNAADIGTGNYLAVPELSFSPIITTGGSASSFNGNLPANQTAINFTVSGILWDPGTTLTLRWEDINDAGNDSGLAVDDLTFSALATPLTTLVWDLTGGTWNTTNTNWEGGATYADGNIVRFTDEHVGEVVIDDGGVEPARVLVENTTGTYAFTGGELSGSGSLVKNGAGTLSLTSQTSLSSGITINGGRVVTTADSVLGDDMSIAINEGGVLDLGANSDQVGNLILRGGTATTDGLTGVLALGPNVAVQASATTSVLSGTLATNGIQTLFTVANGAAADDLLISAPIIGADRLTFNGSGRTVFTGDNSLFGGGVSLNSGTLRIESATGLGTGAFFFNGGVLETGVELIGDNAITHLVSQGGDVFVYTSGGLEFTNFSSSFGNANKLLTVIGDLTISSVIADGSTTPGVINLAGLVTTSLTLTRDNTYRGGTTVQAGTLKLTGEGAISSSSFIRVDAGATFDLSEVAGQYTITRTVDGMGVVRTQVLRGGGTIIAPEEGLQIDGELSPGGTGAAFLTQALTIQGGPVSLDAEGLMRFELGGIEAGLYDQLLLTAGANIALDGTFVLTLVGGFVPLATDVFTIINSAGGVTGEFANVGFGERVSFAEGSLLVSLDGNSVILSEFVAIPEPSIIALLGLGAAVLIVRVARQKRESLVPRI